MRYYTVWVRSLSYRGHEALTYSSAQPLKPGSLVLVPLQRESVLGFVAAEVGKPEFATKPVSHVFDLPPLPPQLLAQAKWLQQFYGTTVGVVGQQLLPNALTDTAIAKLKPVVANTFVDNLASLTPDQKIVVDNTTKPDTYLLHGITGSGKTRIYIEMALRTLQAGKSALILTPEISLTSQLTSSFRRVFGEQVVLLHSQLTPAQRVQVWLKILTSGDRRQETVDSSSSKKSTVYCLQPTVYTPLVVIGPRSALFSPLSTIGLIVVDEAHETAYKQEQAPYYHAVRVASQLAHEHGATLILGSATPAVGDYYLAEQRHKPILRLSQLATTHDHPPTEVTVVDLKDRDQFTRSSQLSTPLIKAIQTALGRGEQSLVYLNRRGTARVVLCENCGWQALCPHCDLPLVYHGDTLPTGRQGGRFRCHTCGHSEPIVTTCPVCGHPSVTFRSFGTKAITDEVQRLFPEARVQRFDTDNTKAERFEQHYESVKAGDVDILVGTQMLAKGLDLPRLSTLGVVLADSSLYIPDFSATERTYQLLSQVLGRVGRGHVQGHSIIQTYHPESPVLRAAIEGEWDSFYQTELNERRKFHFPPFYHLLKLSCRRATPKSAEAAADKLKIAILSQFSTIEIDGPAPSFHEKLQGKYQYQLVVKSTSRRDLVSVIKLIPTSGWNYDIDPMNLL